MTEDRDKAIEKYACQVFAYRLFVCDENEDVFTHGEEYVRTRLIACLEDALSERECTEQIRDGSLAVETYSLDALSLVGAK